MTKTRPLTDKQKVQIKKWLDDAVDLTNKIKALTKRSDALKLHYCDGVTGCIQLSNDSIRNINGFDRVCEALDISDDLIHENVLESINCIERYFNYKGYKVMYLIHLEDKDECQ